MFNRKTIFIGSFNTAESAARAYDRCMRDLNRHESAKAKEALEKRLNFRSDAVAHVAAKLSEDALCVGELKLCAGCGEPMGVRLRVCRECRAANTHRSAYKGVRAKSERTKPKGGGPGVIKFQSFLWHDRANVYLGTFHTEEEAALAFDDKVREVYGDAVAPDKLNWPTREEGLAAAAAAAQVQSRVVGCALGASACADACVCCALARVRQSAEAPRAPIGTKRRRGAAAAEAAAAAAAGGEAGGAEGSAAPAAEPLPPKVKKQRKPKAAAATAAAAAGGAAGDAGQVVLYGDVPFCGADDAAALPPLSAVPCAPLPPPPAAAPAPAAPAQPVDIFAALGIE